MLLKKDPNSIKNKLFFFVVLAFILTFSSCGNDNDNDSSSNDLFYSGALTTATTQQLEGRWAIFQVEYEGQRNDVPIFFPECGRDFFDFKTGGAFNEYTYGESYECKPQKNTSNWTLSNGIITASNANGTDQWVITELGSNRLVFKFRLDADSDGTMEVFKAICYRYEPPMETDVYSGTFFWDNTLEHSDKILLRWEGYKGYNEFEKYEIYVLGESCNVSNAELVSTITDVNQTSFIPDNPPLYNEICYVFKIYTNDGLLGTSNAITVSTSSIVALPVALSVPILSGNLVQLNWQQYNGYHFSHYEIVVRNYSSGSGYGFQEEQIAVIDNIETTSYLVELPYFANPVYVINCYNIYGARNQTIIEGQNQRSSNFVREEILPIKSIRFLAFSPDEAILFYSDFLNLYRYNYNSRTVESSTELNSSSIVFVQVFKSTFGTEVIVNTGSALKVYDVNLNFKYDLLSSVLSPDYLVVTKEGYWLITDRKNLYSLSRTSNNLNLISTNGLYNEHFCCSRINVMDLGQNRILAGNYTKSQGLIVGINSNGELTNDSVPVNLNATSQWKNNSLFSENELYVINVEDNTLFSTNTYELVATVNQNFFPSGISNDGSLILGTNNNPQTNTTSFHEKKVRTLSYPSLNEQIYNSKGYPNIVFQNHLGQLISISKGLIGSLSGSSPENDIFIEVVE